MNLVYIDESGNTGQDLKNKQQPVFLLSAIIIHESKWFKLEEDFNEIVNYYWPDSKENIEIHATDLVNRRKAFDNFDLNKTLEIRDKILQLFITHKVPLVYINIHKNRYEKFCEENYGPGIKIDPYIMALPFICVKIDQLLKEKGNDEFGMFIFDEQKEYFTDAEKSIKTLRLDSGSALKTTNILEKGFFVDSKKSFALQLADVAAFYARKFSEENLGFKVSDYHKQTFQTIGSIRINAKSTHSEDLLGWVKDNHMK